jgi:ABC-2 type transport system ATP-binding protein
VDGVTFEIKPGEIVGFLGPNGAGKTTTLKMLSGLLFPTSGDVQVLGFTPSKRQAEYLRQITLVMGNRNQLAWDLPALDSFELQRSIYNLQQADFKQTRDEFIERLEVGELVNKPVRNLSLGERMKVEIIGALLHRPKILFLDEPTIGLDVTMQRRIRSFIDDYNRSNGATILLTSHYMADVEALCKRVIVIHHGIILYDGELSGLVERFSAFKTVQVTLANSGDNLDSYGEIISQEGAVVTLRIPKVDTPQVTARILTEIAVDDLTVEDPPIEDAIEHVFSQSKPETG